MAEFRLRGTDAPLPPLRTRLEAMPWEDKGVPMYMLRDLENLTERSVALTGGGMVLASLLDGKRSAEQIRDMLLKSTGEVLETSKILDLVSALEQEGFLETADIAARRKKSVDDFAASPKRAPAFAGLSYAAEPLVLAGQLGKYCADEKGPRRAKADAPTKPAPAGLVAPHIDFPRGGPAYGWAYQTLSEHAPPDVIVALGVAHMSPDSPWIFTPKNYATPFGEMSVDAEMYSDLTQNLWYEPRADEWTHKTEHSLEFQAVWLKYLWRDKTPPWVPILVSSFERFSPDQPPANVPTIEKALKDMAAAVRAQTERGRKVLILCGIDLAHVGPRFGDDVEMSEELLKKIEDEDRSSLVNAMTLDADGFYRATVAGEHWRKVCGLSALYTGLRLMKEAGRSTPGRLLAYDQAPDPAGGIVSFASAIFD